MSHKRMAVCAGYAYVIDSLAKIVNIDTREVSGYTKQNYNDYGKLGGLHAWTIVKISHPWYIPHLLNNTVTDWVETHCGEYHLWDGQIAFKEARDATLFLLKWS